MPSRNVTFLIIARDFASRVMNNVGDSTDRAATKLRNLDQLGIKPLATAGATLGPALLPVMAGAAVGAVGLGTALLGAGAGMAVFGAVTKSVFGEVLEASQKSEALREKISLLTRQAAIAGAAGDEANQGKYLKARTRATYEYQARLAELPAPMRAAVVGMDSMRTSWEGFVESNRTPVLGLMARGSTTLAAALPMLQPLFDVTSRAAGVLMNVFEEFVGGGGLERLVAFLSARAGPAFEGFGLIISHLAIGVGGLLAPFAATSDGIVGGLADMTGSFATWGQTAGRAGMERILGFARAEGPGAAAALGELARSIGTIAQAAAPLAPVSAAIALALGQIINALPQPVLTALIGGFIAWNLAVSAARVATLGMAAVTRVMAAATWAMNSALLANPLTWVVIGLVALAAGLVIAYQRSETFRRIVHAALNGAVAAGRAVVGFFRGVPGFFTGMWGTVSQAFARAGVWMGQRLNSMVGWVQALPGRLMSGIMALPGLWFGFWLGLLNRMAFIIGFGIGRSLRITGQLPGQIMRGIRALPGLVWGLMTSTWNGARSRVSAGVTAVVGFVRTLPSRARSAALSLGSVLWGVISSAMSGARTRVSTGISAIVGFFRGLPGKARSAVSGTPGAIRSAFAGAATWLAQAGQDVIMGLVGGIGRAAGAAVSKARDVASSIVGGVKAGLGIGSPSRVMADEVGRWIPPGIIAGIESATPGMLGRMGGVMDRLVGAAGRDVVGSAALAVDGYATAGGGSAMVAAESGGGVMLQPVQLVVDGRVLHQVLLRIKRQNGGVSLGLG